MYFDRARSFADGVKILFKALISCLKDRSCRHFRFARVAQDIQIRGKARMSRGAVKQFFDYGKTKEEN
jgi:hypothetical protein